MGHFDRRSVTAYAHIVNGDKHFCRNRSAIMLRKFPGFSFKQRGVTATEYALIITVVALVMLIGAQLLGSNLSSLFSSVGADV